MADLLEVTDANFEESVLKSELPVLIDFWAPWCRPCLNFAPVIEAVAKEYEGKLTVAKMDIEEHKSTATTYGIASIPTVILFKDGEVADRLMGAVPKAKLVQMLDANLG